MITLIHPSRGRPLKSFNTVKEWLQKARDKVEVIVSIDTDDPYKQEYKDLYLDTETPLFVNPNESLVEATNIICPHATGDILLYLSDDFECPWDWDVMIEAEFAGIDGPCLLKVHDMLQEFDNTVLTIPIMNQALYKRLGYFWFPEFKSQWVDVHLYLVCEKLGVMKLAPNLKFPHNHFSTGLCANDETYKRSVANWKQGEDVLNRQKELGLPV